MYNIGDLVHSIAQPIARGIDKVAGTDIEHCGGCAKRREALNSLGSAVYNKLWQEKVYKNMEYIVVKQYAVEADTPEEAITKSKDAQAMSVSVNPRPPSHPFPPRPQ